MIDGLAGRVWDSRQISRLEEKGAQREIPGFRGCPLAPSLSRASLHTKWVNLHMPTCHRQPRGGVRLQESQIPPITGLLSLHKETLFLP